ncbi:MAG TPA: serine/threonine-protein kinase, partial [Polyangiaceae bacterium]|nr:serine/threonine-protein kinase [Polyangiaceae bacterium]
MGRYAVFAEIASGGMASVHLGRLIGSVGFTRTVAIKRLHPHLARNPDFVAMFLDEARLAARIRHPNVVHTLDVVSDEHELLLVMEYVQGETLARLVRAAHSQKIRLPPSIASGIAVGALDGLHAAHEATSERGTPLGIVHRDVSPQNVLVGRDGVARVLDFGVAKAAGRLHETKDGSVKGKFAYMAPEQLGRTEVDRRADIFAAGVVIWEALTAERLFDGDNLAEIVHAVISRSVPAPSSVAADIPPELDAVVLKALEREVDKRYASAHDMAVALERVCRPASAREIGEWVEYLAAPSLRASRTLLERIESETSTPADLPPVPQEISSAVTTAPQQADGNPSYISSSHARAIPGSNVSAHSTTGAQATLASKWGALQPRVQEFFRPFGESIVPWWKALGVLALLGVIVLALLFAAVTFHRFFRDRAANDANAPADMAAPSNAGSASATATPSAALAPSAAASAAPTPSVEPPSGSAAPAESAAPADSTAAGADKTDKTSGAPTAGTGSGHRH